MLDADRSLTLAELELARPLVERSIGRELRHTERVVDVFKLTAALEKAKADLAKAIKAEQRRAVRAVILGGSRKIKLKHTAAMREPLDRLHRLGQREALAELRRAGYDIPARSMVAEPIPGPEGYHGYVGNELVAFSVRLDKHRVELTSGGAVQNAVIGALYVVPGAMDIASRVVSTALDEGFSSTFSDLEDLASGWEYTAVLDDATCDACEGSDGEEYATWAEAEVMVPNAECAGEGRCRCEIIPLGPL